MTHLEQILLAYAQEKVVPAYLVVTEYQCSAAVIEQLETTLRQMLLEEGATEEAGRLSDGADAAGRHGAGGSFPSRTADRDSLVQIVNMT